MLFLLLVLLLGLDAVPLERRGRGWRDLEDPDGPGVTLLSRLL